MIDILRRTFGVLVTTLVIALVVFALVMGAAVAMPDPLPEPTPGASSVRRCPDTGCTSSYCHAENR